jgi:hypothetical protein
MKEPTYQQAQEEFYITTDDAGRLRSNLDRLRSIRLTYVGLCAEKDSPKLRAKIEELDDIIARGEFKLSMLRAGAAGTGKKRGLPVSIHNVWCDKECGRQSAAYLARVQAA